MLGHCVLALVLVAPAIMADYVPGTPGGSWTTEELGMVKAKINWVIDNPEDAMMSLTKDSKRETRRLQNKIRGTMSFFRKKDNLDSIIPTAAKFVRLTFHDCLKETDTGAGCNGCFNFNMVPTKWYMDGPCSGRRKKVREDFCIKKEGDLRPQIQNETDNNNLLWICLVLEEIYTKLEYGPFKMQSESLFQSGKSRADLWAYAGLVTVQKTIENNNKKCNDDKLPAPCLLQVDSSSKSCKLEAGIPNFRTGRSDCIPNCGEDKPNFCTTEMENHPDPHGNGNKTAEFFAEDFGLDVQEAVALLGAHSLGRTHRTTSMFSNKPWTPQGQSDWNNFYYINGVNKTGFRFADPTILGHDVDQCNLNNVSGFTGDEEGKPVPIKFRVKSERATKNHGPFNWQLFSTGCSALKCQELSIANSGRYHENSCCHWLAFCIDNQDDCPFDLESFDSPNFVSMNINMLNVDMGFVFDFETDADGRPYGCPGLDNERWLANKERFSGEVDCPLNKEPSGLGDDPDGNVRTFFAEFDFYAKNPQNWVDTFTRSYDAMLENGVDNSTLTAAPTDWFKDSKSGCA